MSHFAQMAVRTYDPAIIQAILDARAPWPSGIVYAFDSFDFEMQWWICRWEVRDRLSKLEPGTFKYVLLKQDEEFYAHFLGARHSAMQEWRTARVTGMPRLLPYSPVDHYESTSYFETPASTTPPQPWLVDECQSVVTPHHDHSLPGPAPQAELEYAPVQSSPTYQQPYELQPPTPEFAYHPMSPSPSPSPAFSEEDLSPAPYRVIRAPAPPLIQFTGDWEVDALAHAQLKAEYEDPIELLFSPVPSSHSPEPAPVRRRRRRPRDLSLPRLKIPKCRKGTKSPRNSWSPKLACASPGACCSPDRCVERRGKPVSEGKMACLFCRGRKIACSAPGDDNPDKTCNQCARRDQICVYPTENRRGMRRRRCDFL